MDLFDGFNVGGKETQATSIHDVFRGYLKAGNLAGALKSVSSIPIQDAHTLMLEVGFTITGGTSKGGQKEFWLCCQQEIAKACRHRVDGWGLRDINAIANQGRGTDHELDERNALRDGSGESDRGNGLVGRTDSGSLGERVAGANQEAAGRGSSPKQSAGPGEVREGSLGAGQQSDAPGAARDNEDSRDSAKPAGVKEKHQEWVSEEEAERLSKAYSADIESKPGQPRKVKVVQMGGKDFTVFSNFYHDGVVSVSACELVPVEQFEGQTQTYDQMIALWSMDLSPRGDHTGLLVQSRGRNYAVSRDVKFLNRDNPPNHDVGQESPEHVEADEDSLDLPQEADFDIDETRTGLEIDLADAETLRDSLQLDIDPATGNAIHSAGLRLQLETELENLESGIANAQEVLAAAPIPPQEIETSAPDEFRVGDRIVLDKAANDSLVGRHGEVIEVRPITMRTVRLFSGEPQSVQRIVHYTVRTDEGTKLSADHDYLSLEQERTGVVIPDPMVDGEYMPPNNLLNSIEYYRKRAQEFEAGASRARKAENKAAQHRQADAMQSKAAQYRQAWETWAEQNPDAAEAIAGPAQIAYGQESLPTGVRLASFEHTQTKAVKYAVNLENRVERDVYVKINSMASQYDGRWSSFGRDGAIPGFLFNSEAAARDWVKAIAPIAGLEMPAPPTLSTTSADVAIEHVHMEDIGTSSANVDVNPLDEILTRPYAVTILPLTSGAYKGWYQAKAVDGNHSGVVGNADRTEEGARQELARAILEREQNGIGKEIELQLQPGPISQNTIGDKHVHVESPIAQAPAAVAASLAQIEPAYAISQEDAEGLFTYFRRRFADDAYRIEAFAKLVNRAVDGVVENKGSDDAFNDPVKWAGEWLRQARKELTIDTRADDRAQDNSPVATVHSAPAPAEKKVQAAPETVESSTPDIRQPMEVIESAVTAELSPEGRHKTPRHRAPSSGVADEPTDLVIRDDDEIGKGGVKQKYRDNIEAIRLLKQLEDTERRATPEEQRVLARYVGWGGLKGVFNPNNQDWAAERVELASLLNDVDYAAARRSQLDAHYTSQVLIKAIYGGLQRLGFDGGQMLEPAIGIGNFVGMMPVDMRSRSHVFGVELDVTTGRIARHLYPNSDITVGKGFQDISIPSGFFDVAVGNPPFGNQSVFDAEHPELSKLSLHNFFFAKSMDKLRPEGVMAMVVSRYFMDAQDGAAREWIADRAKLLGAYRLPNTAFKENANTEVVADIIFLQKLKEGEIAERSWVETVDRVIDDWVPSDEDKPIRINRYFADNPSHVLGTETLTSNQYSSNEYTVEPMPGWESDLAALVRHTLPEGAYRAGVAQEVLEKWVDADTIMPNHTKVGAFFIAEDGGIYRRLSDQFDKARAQPVELSTAAAIERAKGLIGVRNALRALMRVELSEDSDELTLMRLRSELNRSYDGFVKRHGYINSLGNRRAFAEDPDLPLLESLEPNYDPGISREVAVKQGVEPRKPGADKADIFQKRVLSPHKEVTQVESAKDGLIASLNYCGRVDIGYISGLYGKGPNETISELRGLVFQDPDKGWVTSDEYLSGNVKHKLARAQDAAKNDPVYSENIAALESVQPPDISPMDIRVRLGSPWVPPWVIEQFVKEMWAPTSLEVAYIPAIAQWSFKSEGGDQVALVSRWGTSDVPAGRIVDSLLNNRSIVVRENIGTTREPHWIVLDKETEAARVKAEEVGQRFKDWVWQDHDRCEKLGRIYNDTMNTNRERAFDGKHLTLPGANPAVKLRPSQKSAIWRGVAERVMLLDHRVGAGKTYTMIGVAMEMRRLGIQKKPLLCVPNHLVRQWRDSFYALYPGANILAATEADFEMANRHKLFARVSTGDWDAVIIGHSSLKKIGLPAETEQGVLKEMMDDISDAIEKIKSERGDRNVSRDMERIKDNLQTKLDRLNDKTGDKDNVVTFDELGVDGLFVDELDEFKNLFFTTTMQQVAGLGNASGSGKAFDLFVKRRWLVEKYGEQAVFVGGTGTPISNSLVEMFTMQRYMIYDELRRRNIHLLDAWAGCFGDVQHVYEVHPSGSGYRMSTRFAKFVNMPELMTLYRGFADVVTLEDLQAQAEEQGLRFPVPKLAGGKPKNLVAERSELQKYFFGVPVFVRGEEEKIVFNENRDPTEIDFAQAPDSKWVWALKSQIEHHKEGKFDSREAAMADYVADYLAPATGFNEGSILWQYENLRSLTRETNGKINALSITNSARKAGLDYRLIDPSAPDHPDSKINLAADEIVRIYKKWEKDHGTQLVFCDLSVPLSERERIGSAERKAFIRVDTGELSQVKVTTHPIPDTEEYVFYAVKQGRHYHAYDAITGNRLPMPAAPKRADVVEMVLNRAKTGMEWYDQARGETSPIDDAAIDAWRAERGQVEEGKENEQSDSVTMTDLLAVAGKSRFSVYDDLRTKLIERGIPIEEIAFIHDYDTAKKKAELFKAINDGRKRVTFGSTPKMGAGTNVQQRLVGLHHLDCPWRPRDLEQRDGRIERQGNLLYERDPDGFEVEIMRYATKQTYDTRMWQIVEHKARGVQQLRKAGKAEREIDDLGGEAASAADMKAAASGNPLILEEIRLRNEVKSLDAQRDGWLRARHDLGHRLNWLKDSFKREQRARELFEPMIAHRVQHSSEEFRFKASGRTYSDRQEAGNAIQLAMVRALKSRPGEDVDVGEYRGFRFEMSRENAGVRIAFGMPGMKAEHHVAFYHTEHDKFSASGLIQRMDNRLAEFEEAIVGAVKQREQAAIEIPGIEAELQLPFIKEAELGSKRDAHREVIQQLKKAGGSVQLTDEMRNELRTVLPERIEALTEMGIHVDAELVKALLEPPKQNTPKALTISEGEMENSLSRAMKFAEGINSEITIAVKDVPGYVHVGKVVDIQEHHIVQDVGRGLVVHRKADLTAVPGHGAYIRLAYDPSTGKAADHAQAQTGNGLAR